MLTKDDVTALRQCDRLSFHFLAGESEIHATKRLRDTGPFGERERQHEFKVESEFRCFRGDAHSNDKPRACFTMIHGMYENSNCGPTLARLVKPGDELRLHWIADNGSPLLQSQAPSLHRDELHVSIIRRGKPFAYLTVDVALCADNTARMIRF